MCMKGDEMDEYKCDTCCWKDETQPQCYSGHIQRIAGHRDCEDYEPKGRGKDGLVQCEGEG